VLQVLNAEYVALLRQGRDAEAQAVFGRIIAIGLASRNLSMRLLFAPGSTDFWPDPAVTQRYGTWLAELADQAQASRDCLQVVGHSGRTPRETQNRQLALQRANVVRQILLRHVPALAPRLTTLGVGDAFPLVGTGTNDLRDAADRRVDFRVVDCP
jgi:outer membrane protein OmpA-like peptidoglycan-associated protein